MATTQWELYRWVWKPRICDDDIDDDDNVTKMNAHDSFVSCIRVYCPIPVDGANAELN